MCLITKFINKPTARIKLLALIIHIRFWSRLYKNQPNLLIMGIYIYVSTVCDIQRFFVKKEWKKKTFWQCALIQHEFETISLLFYHCLELLDICIYFLASVIMPDAIQYEAYEPVYFSKFRYLYVLRRYIHINTKVHAQNPSHCYFIRLNFERKGPV
jgi:hypothetical protein